MIEGILTRKNYSLKTKITIKSLISAGLIAVAVILPQLTHLAAGQDGGIKWLPMYLPVLIGGCILGFKWGLIVGIASPVLSFVITSAMGNPMPALARLPFMAAELAVFAIVSGSFSKKIAKNGWMAFPAVLLAQLAGRAAFVLLALAFQSVTQLTATVILNQIQSGLAGLFLQAVTVPFAVMGLNALLNKQK